MKFWHSCVTQCPVLFRFKEWSPASGSKTGGSGVTMSIWENYGEVSWMVKLFEFFNMVVIFHKMSGSAKIKTSPATPAYYSCEHAHSRHISSTSHFWHLLEARADKKNDPWCLPVILVWSNLTFMKIHILMKFWHHMSKFCNLRRIHKYMGKLWGSLLNGQTFRIFQYGGYFLQNVRLSKN